MADRAQISDCLLMIKPAFFGFNEQTEKTCGFGHRIKGVSGKNIHAKALKEFGDMVDKLKSLFINVIVFNDTKQPVKPDAIFPNNWVSFHENGIAVLYPMFAENRRAERRKDILNDIKEKYGYKIKKIIDLSYFEEKKLFLEGTGSMVFDRVNKITYACISPRTDSRVLKKFAREMKYDTVVFNAVNKSGNPIYHTNVAMSIGDKFAIICPDVIPEKKEYKKIYDKLRKTGHEILEISEKQMNNFAGNALNVKNTKGEKFLIISQKGYKSLDKIQKSFIEKYANIIPSPIKTIEIVGGGSARCMLAEIFLPLKN